MQQLIDQIKTEIEESQDSVEFSALYDKYAPAVYGRILQVVKQKDIAETILEKVFIKAFSNSSVKTTSQLSPFITLLNESRNKSYSTIKAMKVLGSLCSASSPKSVTA